ncbi:hypothetical protein LRB11_16160 [Ectothiorhodospira haloalkaliphila]|uniref:hypothetical protein n=1 Tax=Ectothiorhodospira haloalkaliphila TaxID=421628 RepID=UPI001EE99895|nr:hypothetical protein [Ectothiorhodospira haloalkaliphila]MCG5526441.1 hypothetical protein [Ectothiorhodospira haloalkaliphila]
MDPQFQEGGVSRMPWPDISDEHQEYLAKLAMQNAALVEKVTSFDETTHYFRGVVNKSLYNKDTAEAERKIINNEYDADHLMADYLSLSKQDGSLLMTKFFQDGLLEVKLIGIFIVDLRMKFLTL